MFLFQMGARKEEAKKAEKAVALLQKEAYTLVSANQYADLKALSSFGEKLKKLETSLSQSDKNGAAFLSEAYSWLAKRFEKLRQSRNLDSETDQSRQFESMAKKINTDYLNEDFRKLQLKHNSYFHALNCSVAQNSGEQPYTMFSADQVQRLAALREGARKAPEGTIFIAHIYFPTKELADKFNHEAASKFFGPSLLEGKVNPVSAYDTFSGVRKEGFVCEVQFTGSAGRAEGDFLEAVPATSEFALPAPKPKQSDLKQTRVGSLMRGSLAEQKSQPHEFDESEFCAFIPTIRKGDVFDSEGTSDYGVRRLENLYYAAHYEAQNRESFERVISAMKEDISQLAAATSLKGKELLSAYFEKLFAEAGANVEAFAVYDKGGICRNYGEFSSILFNNYAVAGGREELIRKAAVKLLAGAGFTEKDAQGIADKITVHRSLHLYQDLSPKLIERLIADPRCTPDFREYLTNTGRYEGRGYRHGDGQKNLDSFIVGLLGSEGEEGLAYRTLTKGKLAAFELGNSGHYKTTSATNANMLFSTKSALRDESGFGNGFSEQIKKGRYVQLEAGAANKMTLHIDQSKISVEEGKPVAIRITASIGGAQAELTKLKVIVYDKNEMEQEGVQPVKNPDGSYTVTFAPPKPGEYYLVVYGASGSITSRLAGRSFAATPKPEEPTQLPPPSRLEGPVPAPLRVEYTAAVGFINPTPDDEIVYGADAIRQFKIVMDKAISEGGNPNAAIATLQGLREVYQLILRGDPNEPEHNLLLAWNQAWGGDVKKAFDDLMAGRNYLEVFSRIDPDSPMANLKADRQVIDLSNERAQLQLANWKIKTKQAELTWIPIRPENEKDVLWLQFNGRYTERTGKFSIDGFPASETEFRGGELGAVTYFVQPGIFLTGGLGYSKTDSFISLGGSRIKTSSQKAIDLSLGAGKQTALSLFSQANNFILTTSLSGKVQLRSTEAPFAKGGAPYERGYQMMFFMNAEYDGPLKPSTKFRFSIDDNMPALPKHMFGFGAGLKVPLGAIYAPLGSTELLAEWMRDVSGTAPSDQFKFSLSILIFGSNVSASASYDVYRARRR